MSVSFVASCDGITPNINVESICFAGSSVCGRSWRQGRGGGATASPIFYKHGFASDCFLRGRYDLDAIEHQLIAIKSIDEMTFTSVGYHSDAIPYPIHGVAATPRPPRLKKNANEFLRPLFLI